MQGRAYSTDEVLDETTTYTTTLTLDVMGNPTVVTDAREIDTQTQSFDMLGRPLVTVSPDAGTDRVIHNVTRSFQIPHPPEWWGRVEWWNGGQQVASPIAGGGG